MPLTIFLLAVLLHLSTATQELCHWGDSKVSLDATYHDGVCIPRKKLKLDGTCELSCIGGTRNKGCDSFCQVRTRFFYGNEQPYLSQGYYSGVGEFKFAPEIFQIYLGNRA